MRNRLFASGLMVAVFGLMAGGVQECTPQQVEDAEYARLAHAVYFDWDDPGGAGAVIQNLKDGGWEISRTIAHDSGLQATVYIHRASNRKVLAFQGTDVKDWRDIRTDVANALGVLTAQYQAAAMIARQEKTVPESDVFFRLILVGHSLGGGMAQYAAGMTGVDAVTFNPAAVASTATALMKLRGGENGHRVRNYCYVGDPLTMVVNPATTPRGAFPQLSPDDSALRRIGLSVQVFGTSRLYGAILYVREQEPRASHAVTAIISVMDASLALCNAMNQTKTASSALPETESQPRTPLTTGVADWRYSRQGRIGHASLARAGAGRLGDKMVVRTTLPSADSTLVGDLDDDGKLEIVATAGSALLVYSGSGELQQRIKLPHPCFLAMLEDADGDGALEMFLGSSGRGFSSYVYRRDGALLKSFAGRHAGGEDVTMRPIALVRDKLLVGYNAGYARTPRGVAAVDYESGTELWYYQIGPANGNYSVADMEGDGNLDVVMSSYTVHNGASGNRTTDGDLFVIVVDEDGGGKLTVQYSGTSNGSAEHVFADLDEDGRMEVIGFKGHDPVYYPGTSAIESFGRDGRLLHSFAGPRDNGWSGSSFTGSFAVGDLDGDHQVEIVATALPSLRTYVLDRELAVRHEAQTQGEVKLLGDLYGDGFGEIVLLSNAGLLSVCDRNLKTLDSLQVGARGGEVLAADLDGDGGIELVCRTDVLRIVAFGGEPRP